MKNFAKSSLALIALTLAAASVANAAVPEIDPAMGTAGLTLLAGSIMVIRGLRKR